MAVIVGGWGGVGERRLVDPLWVGLEGGSPMTPASKLSEMGGVRRERGVADWYGKGRWWELLGENVYSTQVPLTL